MSSSSSVLLLSFLFVCLLVVCFICVFFFFLSFLFFIFFVVGERGVGEMERIVRLQEIDLREGVYFEGRL